MKKVLSFCIALGLFISANLCAFNAEQAPEPAGLLTLKSQILAQMKDAAKLNSIDGHISNDSKQLFKEPSLFGNMWKGALGGAATVVLFIPAAIGAGVSKLLVGNGSGMGPNLVSGLVGFSAALGALPTALIGIPVAPVGAGVGAGIGVKAHFDEKNEISEVVEKIWGHLAFIYNLLLVGETDFMQLSGPQRIRELTTLRQQLEEENRYNSGDLRVNQFINYNANAENNLRAEVMTAILRTKAFRTSQGTDLSEETISSFIEYFHRNKPDYILDSQSKEAAILVIRFVDTYLKAYHYSSINTADAIQALVK